MKVQPMNYFAHKPVAERYSHYRPYFHPLVIEKIRSHLGIKSPVERALDVGCGTGQSTIALKELANSVGGVDISTEMLKLAKQQPGIEYINCSAEDLSMFESGPFDLITTSMAYHWFDYTLFLSEVYRLLSIKDWLIVYSNGFNGEMVGNPSCKVWSEQIFAKHSPTSSRNRFNLTPETAAEFGFATLHTEDYQNDVQFTPEQISSYLTTQSNVISAVEQGNEKFEDVYNWLVSEVKPFFVFERETFIFTGYIWYLQKVKP
ncbi:MAG TPA: class I SAM-dependent methyltransferase [Anaerolineales bacterium]|nr:class I SAM-dependent methyltransferase [Anaerolineales bacterium]